jgi:hypothetical protein
MLSLYKKTRMANDFSVLQGIGTQISQIQNGSNDNWKDASHPTIFHEILSSDLLEEEKSYARL